MILASCLGIFVIPPLYVSFQAVRERLRPAARPEKTASGAKTETGAVSRPEAAE
jgi:hypothetical protein